VAFALLPKKSSGSNNDPEDFRATLGEHLEELRTRILRVLGVLLVMTVVGWFLALPAYVALDKVVQANIPTWLKFEQPFKDVTQPFMLQLKLAFYIGLTIALPHMVLEIWGFVKPGLKPNEIRPVRVLGPISVVLFLVGCWVGWMMIPPSFQWFAGFFASFPGTALYQEPGAMVFLIVKIVLAFGIGFELPVVTFFLAKIGVIAPETLFRYWRQATIAIFFLSACLTPSGDPFTMTAMALPLAALFFVSVFAVRLTSKGKGRDPALDSLD
jgi:sec-independent protein translocase protein TatC